MRYLLLTLCLCLAGCNPLSPSTPQNYVFTQSLTPQADLNFAFLKMHQALNNEDLQTITEAYNALLTGPSSSVLGEPIAWLISKGYLKEAQELLQKTIRAFPDDLSPHIMSAELILFVNENTDQAVAVLEDFVALHPTDYNALTELAIFHVKINRPQDAISYFQQIPESELSPMIHYYIGHTYRLLGELEKAVEHLNMSLRDAPNFLEALLELAQVQETLGNFDLAKKYYKELLEHDTYNNDLLLYLIRINLKQGNPEEALNIATSKSTDYSFAVSAASILLEEGRADLALALINSIENLPEAPDDLAFYQGVLTYEGLNDVEKAMEYLESVPDTSLLYEDSLHAILQIQLDKARYDDALETIDKGLEYYPSHLGFLSLRYRTLLYTEKYEEAISAMEELLELTPNDIELGFSYAFAHNLQGDIDKSLELMQELLKKDPENPDILNYIGYVWAERNINIDKSLEYIQKALKYQPEASFILDSLAWVYFRMGEYDKAWENIQKALDFAPPEQADPAIWDHYGDIAFALDKKDEARKGWEHSLQIKESEEVRKKLEAL